VPPQPPQPQPQPQKPKENLDEDVRGLFEFLDKVGSGGRPTEERPAQEKEEELAVVEVVEEPPPVRLQDERTRTMKHEPVPRREPEPPLFSLLDEVAAKEPLHRTPRTQAVAPPQPPRPPQAPLPPRPPQPQAPPPPAGDQGGLMAFLKKKKQQP
jgi:hypothetical protein